MPRWPIRNIDLLSDFLKRIGMTLPAARSDKRRFYDTALPRGGHPATF
jgi:hypothetical protein